VATIGAIRIKPRGGPGNEGIGRQNAYWVFVGSDARTMDPLYRINPSGAASFIARQMKDLLKA
jgi:hypothetical protein